MKMAKSSKKENHVQAAAKSVSPRRLYWLIPLIAVLMAAAVLSILFFMQKGSGKKLEKAVYQFGIAEKYEFGSGTTLVKGKREKELKTEDGERMSCDATPLYYQEETSMMLVGDNAWLDPITQYEWRVPEFSVLSMDENNVITCETEKADYQLSGGVMNDGAGTYLFLDKGVLIVNGEEIEISPFSFYSNTKSTIRVYSYGEEEFFSTLSNQGDSIHFYSRQGYSVNLVTGICNNADETFRLLVASPAALRGIEER